MFVDSLLIINQGADAYSFPKTRPGSSYSAIPSDYRLKYDGNGKLEWVDVNALTAVVGDVIDSLDNLGDVYVDHPDFNAFIGSNPSNISGNRNTSVGISALKNVTSGANNTAVGRQTMLNNDEGSGNTALGSGALVKNTEGDQNIAVGLDALYLNNTGSDNIALGKLSGVNSLTPYSPQSQTEVQQQSIFIGSNTRPKANNQTNQIVIGYNAVGKGSNTAVLGNDNIDSTFLNGDVKINNGDLIVAENGNQTGGNVYFKDIDKTTYPNYSKLVIDTTNGKLYVETSSGSNTNNWVNNGDDIYYDAGNVGIGRNNPDYDLHVESFNGGSISIPDGSSGTRTVTMDTIVGLESTSDYSVLGINAYPTSGNEGGGIFITQFKDKNTGMLAGTVETGSRTITSSSSNSYSSTTISTTDTSLTLHAGDARNNNENPSLHLMKSLGSNNNMYYDAELTNYHDNVNNVHNGIHFTYDEDNETGWANINTDRLEIRPSDINSNTDFVDVEIQGDLKVNRNLDISDNDYNMGIGEQTLSNLNGGAENIAIGRMTLRDNTSGSSNVALGFEASANNETGSHNITVGKRTSKNITSGNNNVLLGSYAAYSDINANNVTEIDNSIMIGRDAKPRGNNESNQIAIGHQVIGEGSNSVVLGNDNIDSTFLKGKINIDGAYVLPKTAGHKW